MKKTDTRNGKPLATLAPGDKRRLADGRNAWRKMSPEQRRDFLNWIADEDLEVAGGASTTREDLLARVNAFIAESAEVEGFDSGDAFDLITEARDYLSPAGAVIIDGSWVQEKPVGTDGMRYTAIGTKAEVIELRRVYSPSHRTKRWFLNVSPADGDDKTVELGPKASFDDAEGALLVWGTL